MRKTCKSKNCCATLSRQALLSVSVLSLAAHCAIAQEQQRPTELDPIVVKSRGTLSGPGADVYSAPMSTVYASAVELERFGRISAADTLKGMPGIQVGDARNGGSLDVNIRGVQGQNRVAVSVDGAQQSQEVYRGYAGTTNRSYIDPDLISDITVKKGPGLDVETPGSVGGSVKIQTVTADDILLPGQEIGMRLKGELGSNGIAPILQTNADGTQGIANSPIRRDFNGIGNADSFNGSAAFAIKKEIFSFVAAYARRNQGNYAAGSKGREKLQTFDRFGKEERSVASMFKPKDEVANSSSETQSVLLKSVFTPDTNQNLELSYRYFDGSVGEILPSDIFRFSSDEVAQYPLNNVKMHSASARYNYKSEDTSLIDLNANLWLTHTKSSTLGADNAPESQYFNAARSWFRTENLRYGGNIHNTSVFDSNLGEFKLTLGGSAQNDDLRPQSSVLTTEADRQANKAIRDGERSTYSLDSKLEYAPFDFLNVWAAGRYSHFKTQDRNNRYSPRMVTRTGALFELIRRPTDDRDGDIGQLFWPNDEAGNPLPENHPYFDTATVKSIMLGRDIPFKEFGTPNRRSLIDSGEVTFQDGYIKAENLKFAGSAFTPSFGLNYEFAPSSFIYASYSQDVRMPSLFETSLGTLQVHPNSDLRPERARSWEVGISTTQDDLITGGDTAAFKLTFFNNEIKDFITRYYGIEGNGGMTFSNVPEFTTNGLEFQSSYDSGDVFLDLSATYYLNTKTCDPERAAIIRSYASQPRSRWQTADTPDCTPGAFMGSFINTQNPPKTSVSMVGGLRFFDEALSIGGRVTYTSGPTEKMDKPWQKGDTTPQLNYVPTTLFDAFLSYQFNENASFNASINNITDRYYIDPISLSMMPGPGRTFRAGLTVKF